MDGLISVWNNFKEIEFIIPIKNLNLEVSMKIMILIDIMMVNVI